MAAELDDLVNISEKLLCDLSGNNELPRISRNLEQMRNIGQKLHLMRESKSETKAARLLGSKMSYELPEKLSQKLETTERAETVPHSKPIFQQDIRSFLKSSREKAIVDANEIPKISAFNAIQEQSDKCFKDWWSSEISSILAALNGSQVLPILGHQLDSVSGARFQHKPSSKMSNCSSLTREEILYVKIIHHYQVVDFSTRPISELLTHFSDIIHESDNQCKTVVSNCALKEIWTIVRELLQRLPQSFMSKQPIEISSEQVIIQRIGPQLSENLLNAALGILGDEFVEFMRVSISRRPLVSKIGGKPSIRDLVRAYFSLISSEIGASNNVEYDDGLIDSIPVWVMVYHCLRSGYYDEALEVVQESCAKYAHYFRSYVENKHSITSSILSELKHITRQIASSSNDPYKQAVFSLLCRQDFSDNLGLVLKSADDFLWFKLSQVIIPDDISRAPNQQNSLSALQTLIHDTYGERHFQADEQPLLYFKLLLLTQQFEAAIAFLARAQGGVSSSEDSSGKFLCHALHLAICLNHMGLLCVVNGQESLMKPLLSNADMNGIRTLNFSRLVVQYTRRFELHHSPEALDYLAFLCQLSSSSQESAYSSDLFITSLVELLLETNEFDRLLGRIDDPDLHQAGVVDKFCRPLSSSRQSIRGIPWLYASDLNHDYLMLALAQSFDARGRELEAVQAYLRLSHSAVAQGKLTPGLRCINILLVNLIQLDCLETNSSNFNEFGFTVNRDMLIHLATLLATRVRNVRRDNIPGQSMVAPEGDSSIQEHERCLFLMLDLYTFLGLVDEGNWQLALDCLDKLDHFLPSNPNESLETSLTGYQYLPELVKRAVPRIVLAAMRSMIELSRLNKAGDKKALDAPSSTQRSSVPSMVSLENRARAIICFMGRIPQRIPGDFYTRLTRMEAQLLTS